MYIFRRHNYLIMEQEFTTSTGYKIFYGAVAGAAFVVSVYLFTNNSLNANGAGIIFAIILLVVAIAIAMNLYKRKFILFDDSVMYTSIWGSKELLNNNVKGFRLGEKAIFIEPLETGYSRIMVRDYSSIGDIKDLKDALGSRFTDLNKAEFEAEKEEILKDADIGVTEGDRETVFKNTRKYTMVFNFIGMGLFFITIYFHGDNFWLRLLAIIYPLAGLALMKISKGLVRLYAKKNSAYPSILTGLFFSAMITLLMAFTGINILNYDNVWAPALIVFMAVAWALYYLAIKLAKAPFLHQIVFVILISAGYAFGGTVLANSIFDQSKPQVFPTTITDHHITRGSKSTTYHIIIAGWEKHPEGENISVSPSFYDAAEVGSKVNVNLKKGLFNVPWYFISQ